MTREAARCQPKIDMSEATDTVSAITARVGNEITDSKTLHYSAWS